MEVMVKFSGASYLFMHKYKTRIKVLTLYSYLSWLDVYAPVYLNKDGRNSGHAAAEMGRNSERFAFSVQKSKNERKFSNNHAC